MIELKISDVILSNRRKKNLTQEGLALALGVSPQAVSNWERGGYPDITMLPTIANFFEITVDELIGNDKLAQDSDINSLYDRLGEMDDPEAELDLIRSYMRKYPKGYGLVHTAIFTIFGMPKDMREKHIAELRELCDKLIGECTNQALREDAIRIMAMLCDESESGRWLDMCADGYDAVRGEVREARLWETGRHAESRVAFDVNNFHILCHFMFRDNRNWAAPERATERFVRLIKLIELFGDGEVPEAWLGKYANLCFRAACSSFGMGDIDGGKGYLDRAFELYPRWFAIPNGTPLDLGARDIFGGVKFVKNEWRIDVPNGDGGYVREYGGRYGYNFEDGREAMYRDMTAPHGWEWFNGVRECDWFKAYVERAKVFYDEWSSEQNPESAESEE